MKHLLEHVSKKDIFFWSALGVTALTGIIFLRYLTPYGLGLINDSVGYIAGARGILAGNGYSRLGGNFVPIAITNYPPMYSIVLAVLGSGGLDIIRATRLLSMLCIGGNIILAGYIVRRMSGSMIFGLLAAGLFLVTEQLVWIHTFAITEPLYLFLNMLVILWLARYLEKFQSFWLIMAGIVTSAAFLTRLVGLSIYICVMLSILVFIPEWKGRLKGVTLFLVSSLPGAFAWAVRNAVVSGNPSNRTFNYNPISAYKIQEGVINFWNWLLPNGLAVVKNPFSFWECMFYVLFVVLCVWTGYQLWIRFTHFMKLSSFAGEEEAHSSIHKTAPAPERSSSTLLLLTLTQGLVYLILLVFTLIFLDSSPIFEHRILSPFYLCLFLSFMGWMAWMWQRKYWLYKIGTIIFLLAAVISFSLDTIKMAEWLHQTGQGFISLTWRESSLVQIVKELPQITLVSNRPTALYILADRPAYALLAPVNAASREERPDYWENIDRIRQSIFNQEAMLVVFNYQAYLENPDESWWMKRVTQDLPLYGEYWDGAIFGILP